MKYRNPAIILTIVAIACAALVGFLQYRANIERNKQQQKFLEAQRRIVLAQRSAEKKEVIEELSQASERLEEYKSAESKEVSKGPKVFEQQDVNLFTYIPKLIFSIILCGAALYVILSDKYKEETQKWAFGMIGVIVGVWIGSI